MSARNTSTVSLPMAPFRTPGRKRREADYSGIGKYGRKTGITVPDLGPRDEFGLEPVDGLFSSPNRDDSPSNSNLQVSNGEEMELAASSPRNVSDLVASARHRARLPPKSRSPIRTSLGVSPRRLVVDSDSTDRVSRLKMNRDAEDSFFSRLNHRNQSGVGEHPLAHKESGHAVPAGVEAWSSSPHVPNGAHTKSATKRFQLTLEGETPETTDRGASDDLPVFDEAQDPYLISEAQQLSNVSKYVSALTADSESEDSTADHLTESGGFVHDLTTDKHGQAESVTKDSMPRSSKRRKIGGVGIESNGPNRTEGRNEPVHISADRSRRKPVLRAKAKNAGTHIQKTRPDLKTKRITKGSISDIQNVEESGKERTSQKQQAEKKVREDLTNIAPVILRSGRTSVKPLAYWRGEQIVYEPPRKMGQHLLPGGYKGVDPGRHTNEISARPTKRRAANRARRQRNTSVSDGGDDEEDRSDANRETWEIEGSHPGVLNAGVFVWDPETQNRIEDAHEEIELALAPAAIDQRTQWAKGRTFRFGKTLTLPFFHSGIVDLPPGGEKRPKNSRKNHMVFWVFSGRVKVDVSGNVFSVGRGGMWQVPRGNSYGLSNPFARDVRIFFAQGSYMEQPEDETAFMAATASTD